MRWMGVVATSGPAFVGWPHPDACWRVGRPRECCEHEIRGCWDDWWTADRCCDSAEEEAAVADDVCVSDDPQPRPSAAEPFLFLWDEKVGGSTFNRWLLESAAAEGYCAYRNRTSFFLFLYTPPEISPHIQLRLVLIRHLPKGPARAPLASAPAHVPHAHA